jgi:hypothetical protein
MGSSHQEPLKRFSSKWVMFQPKGRNDKNLKMNSAETNGYLSFGRFEGFP